MDYVYKKISLCLQLDCRIVRPFCCWNQCLELHTVKSNVPLVLGSTMRLSREQKLRANPVVGISMGQYRL